MPLPQLLNTELSLLLDAMRIEEDAQTQPAQVQPGANRVVPVLARRFTAQVLAIWSGPRILDYLMATDARRQVWHAWFAAPKNLELDQNGFADDLAYQWLSTAKGVAIIEQAFGFAPPGIMNALAKLGPVARDALVYQQLIQVLAQPGGQAAKLIRHRKQLTDDVILAVASLPAGIDSDAAFELFVSGRLPIDALGFFAWAIDRLRRVGDPEVVQKILRSPSPLVALRATVLEMAFPEPPWHGNGFLEPIVSEKMLSASSHEFDNCLASQRHRSVVVLRILARQVYYYRWNGDEPGFLSFEPLGRFGWALTEARGYKNANLSGQTMSAIAHALKGTCLCPAPVSNWILADGHPYWGYD